MSLTFLKESEVAHPDNLVTGHYPLKSLMSQRKFNVRASFTPATYAASSQHPPAPRVSDAVIGHSYEQPRHTVHPATFRSSPALSHRLPSLYSSSDAMRRVGETQSHCGCPSRHVNVLNLPSSQYNLLLDLVASVGELEQKPEHEADKRLSLQFYDMRSSQKLAELLPTVAPLAGVLLQQVPLESDVCVLVDIPWGQNLSHDSLLAAMERYGSVATLSFGTSLMGGPQQVVCVYNDVRDATKVLNKLICVHGIQLPVRLLSLPHAHACPSLNANHLSTRKHSQSTYPGIGIGSLESPPIAPAFASSTAAMSPLSSPYSTTRSDVASSYFSPVDNPWTASNKTLLTGSDLIGSQVEQHSINPVSPHLIGINGHPIRRAASNGEFEATATEHTHARPVAKHGFLNTSTKEEFSGTYGPIGSAAAVHNASTKNTVFDSILHRTPFGPLSNTPAAVAPHCTPARGNSSARKDEKTHPLDAKGGGAVTVRTSGKVPPRQAPRQELEKCIDILKKFADSEGKTNTKESKPSERERERERDDGNDIDLEAIEGGKEMRTTVMLRNIPNKLDFKDLKRFLDATSRCTYDFLYLRFDFMNRCNVGYAFISFTKPKHVATFVKARAGMKWSQYNYNSEKVIEVKFARIQGRDSLIQKFRNSPVMSQDPAFKPRLYYTRGKLSGKEEPFPDPTTPSGTNGKTSTSAS